MYCPKCAAQNLGDAKYCRACGMDIHLVPLALQGALSDEAGVTTGETPDALKSDGKKKKKKEPPTLEEGMENVFVGIAFLIIFLGGFFYFFGGFMIWVWFIIPALACIGEGVGQLIRAWREPARLPPPQQQQGTPRLDYNEPPPLVAAAPRRELNAPDTSEMLSAPASVVEGTTRHLEPSRNIQ
ncbi:MAG: zinc ribbon domain-containing protein [Pyrinomonadaceae bacterium]